MRKITKAGLSVIGAAALLAGLTGPALADTGATATDFVAVGSDTVQNVANFIFDGDQAAHNGFNFSNKSTRVFTFDANGDDNGRALYNNSTPQSSIPWGPFPCRGPTGPARASPRSSPTRSVARATP
jgi:ABC-type phosphate transport system substrate-binding protein